MGVVVKVVVGLEMIGIVKDWIVRESRVVFVESL